MTRKEYLAVLGLREEANWPEVLKAYESLVTVWEPTRFSAEERIKIKPAEKLKQIHRAFEFLSADDVLLARSGTEQNESKSSVGKALSESDIARAFRTGQNRTPRIFSRKKHTPAISSKELIVREENELEVSRLSTLVLVTILVAIVLGIGVISIREMGAKTNNSSDTKYMDTEPQIEIANLHTLQAPTPIATTIPEEKELEFKQADSKINFDLALKMAQTDNSTNKEPIATPTPLTLNYSQFKERDRVYVLGGKTDVDEKLKGYTPDLVDAAINCDNRRVKALLSDGEDINQIDTTGETALSWAVRRRCAKVVRTLIAKGANVNVESDNGFTPYIWARVYHNREIEKILLKHGATPEQGVYWWRYEPDVEEQWLDRELGNACRNRNCTPKKRTP